MPRSPAPNLILLATLFLAFQVPTVALADDNLAPIEKASASTVSFEKNIQPLFRAKCQRCHGGEAIKGDLDLKTAQGIQKGGESGPVIVPGKPDKSLLFSKIQNGEMPPGKKDRLTDAEVQSVQLWISQGAKTGQGDAENSELNSVPSYHDILPILLRRCTACHGLHRKEAGLDLRTKGAMLRGGKTGPAIVLGKPEESRIIQKTRQGKMPPNDRLVEACVKPIEPGEIEKLAKWIAVGAPETALPPDIASTKPDPLVSDKDRAFWSFRPPQKVAIPKVNTTAKIRNPIDAFVVEKLVKRGIQFAPEASKATLMRRAYFDLTGLPPEPAELLAFCSSPDPNAYEKLIDRLLASPRYGERWGRYWLDLAGYADSEGKREQDLPRPHAWRYRDYVIRSLNSDKGYNRFLLEQLAGDELADYEHAPEITQEIYDNLVATGFLRMAPDATWANITGYIPDRLEVIADEIDVLGSAVMGLTLKCARCHTHKFDPIPHRDYYRLVDIFKGALDENDWLKPDVRPGIGPLSQDVNPGRHLPFVTTKERKAWEENENKISQEIKTAKAKPNSEELVKKLEANRRPEPRIQALWDRGLPTPTYIYRRGDPLTPGRMVGPGVPSMLTDGKTPFEVKPPWTGAKQTGRRLAFGQWLTKPDHPLTARVAVNRIWKHHFGSGIVKTLGNFGTTGAPPTHPELLDWLALEFVQNGWSMKSMHRLMMNSTTYRQSSSLNGEQEKADPDNRFVSRMPLTRMDAESLYDSLLVLAGRLDETRFGPGDPVNARADGLVTTAGNPKGWRRLIYVSQMRKLIASHMETFDFPQMNPNCVERRDSVVAPQALHLMNNGMVFRLAEHFATRVKGEVGSKPEQQVERVYLIALSRPPSPKELSLGVTALKTLFENWTSQPIHGGLPNPESLRQKALTDYCHAIINSADFLYVD